MSSFFRLSIRDSYDYAGLFCWLWHERLGEKIQDYSKRRCSGIPYFFRDKRTGRHYFFCTSEIFWLIRFYLSATARNLLPSFLPPKILKKHLEINIASQARSTIIISNSSLLPILWKLKSFYWPQKFLTASNRVQSIFPDLCAWGAFWISCGYKKTTFRDIFTKIYEKLCTLQSEFRCEIKLWKSLQFGKEKLRISQSKKYKQRLPI